MLIIGLGPNCSRALLAMPASPIADVEIPGSIEMSTGPATFFMLAVAVTLEVVGTTFLERSEQFTRLVPTAMMAICYAGAFYFLSQTLKTMPIGIAYAIWSG